MVNKLKLNPVALGYACAIVSAAGMLLLALLGYMGIYIEAVQMMEQWHMFFSLSVSGIITGTIEAAVIGFVFGYAFGWVYNKFA